MSDLRDKTPGHLNQGWTYRDRIQRDAEGSSVLAFYAGRYPHSAPQTWRERIATGQVCLDGQPADPDTRLRTGQLLTYRRPPWREAPVPAEFAILHEDEHLIAVGKPSGLPTLPGGDFLENTLLFLVRQRYPDHPAPIHRLGRGTSGITLFARSPTARRQLSADLRNGQLRKTYRALVSGLCAEDSFTVEAPIGPVPYAPLGYLHAVTADGRPARTQCRVRQRRPTADQTLLEVDIPTGRPHQIRIHLAAAGHPLVGETLYRPGGLPVAPPQRGRAPLPGDCGYLLHAWRVGFTHPHTGEWTTITCPAPAPLQPEHSPSPAE